MDPAKLTLRPVADSDWKDIFVNDARAFGFSAPLDEAGRKNMRERVRDSDVVVVREDSPRAPLVGVAMYFRLPLSLPAGRRIDVPGLTWVSVTPTHRRRGVLRAMITALTQKWESQGAPLAILTASEATIYERFGFGPAVFAHQTHVDLPAPHLRINEPGAQVRFGGLDEVRREVPILHNRWAATCSGAIGRSSAWWEIIFADPPTGRDGKSGNHYLLHPDGYAAYRVGQRGDRSVAEVSEIFTVTDAAHTDLWRVLLSLDLVSRVRATLPVDDPLPTKLIDFRAVSLNGIEDTLWVRLLDIPAALSARGYACDLDAVIEVSDEFRGRGGRFALHIADGEASVTTTHAAPTLRMDISVLSSIYLGGYRALQFELAGRLWSADTDTLVAFDSAFAAKRAPFAGTHF